MNDKRKKTADQIPLEIDSRLVFIAMGLVSIIVFFPLLETGFTTTDDLQTALIGWNAENSMGFLFAKAQGRFNKAINTYLHWIPYLFNNPVIYQATKLGPVISSIVLFFIVVRLYFRSLVLACLTTLLVLSFLQNNWQHSLLTSYPFVFQFGFCMLLMALYSLYRYKISGRKPWAISYGLCYLITLFVSELFVPYCIVFFIIAIGFAWGSERKNFCSKVFRFTLPALASVLVFLCCWLIFHRFYPGNYDGTQMAVISFPAIIRVVFQFSVGTFPGALYLTDSMTINGTFDGFSNHSIGFLPLLDQFKVEWLVKGILASGCCWYLLKEKSDIRTSWIWCFRMILIGILLMIIPFVLLGLTSKYQYWIGFGTLAYTPSFFSYFGTMLTLSSILLFINHAVNQKNVIRRIYHLCVCLLVFFTSGITDYYNYYVTLDQQLSQLKWTCVDKLMKTNEFGEIPEGSTIYAPSLWLNSRGILRPAQEYWTRYFTLKTEKKLTVVQDLKNTGQLVPDPLNLYYLRFFQEPKSKNQFLLFAKLKGLNDLVSETALLFSYSKYKTFTVMGIFRAEGKPVVIQINGSPVPLDNMGEQVFCHQLEFPLPLRDVTKEDLLGKSFVDLVRVVLSRIGTPEADRDKMASGLYRTRIEANAPLELENLTISFFPVQFKFPSRLTP